MENREHDPLSTFQKILKHTFKNKNLLLRALTRPSAIQEGIQSPDIGHFQQLEFIGDKVLNLVMSDILQENNPAWTEGQLTQAVATYVNNKGPLAKIAQAWHLGDLLIMGRGEAIHNGVRENGKVLSDAVEAIIGAIWLDTQHDYLHLKQRIAEYMQMVGLKHATYEKIEEAVLNNCLVTFDKHYLKKYVPENLKAPIMALLIEAIHDGQINNGIKFIQRMLKKSLSQKTLDDTLIDSIGYYQLDTATLLLKHGANPNAVNVEQYSALQLAIKYNYDPQITPLLVELLLTHKANPNYRRGDVTLSKKPRLKDGYISLARLRASKHQKESIHDNDTALHLLLTYHTTSRLLLANMLLKYNANLNCQNNEGKTPLHLVCEPPLSQDENDELIVMLLKAKANPNLQDNQGNTALHLLLQTHDHMLFDGKEFMPIIDRFIEAGIDLDKQNHEGNTVLHLASVNKVVFPLRDNKQTHPISVINRITFIEKLMDSGANISIKNTQDLTASDFEKQIQVPSQTVTLLKEIGYFSDKQSHSSENLIQTKEAIQLITENFKVTL